MGVFRVVAAITWAGQGSPGANIWSVRTGSVTDPDDDFELDAAVDALRDFYTSCAAIYATGTKIEIGNDIVERTSLKDHSRTVRTINSTGAGGAAPHLLSAVVSWRTSLRARRAMGRTFLGPLSPYAEETDGTITADHLAPIQTAAQALVTASLSTLNQWGVGVWGLQNEGSYDASGKLLPGQPHVHRDVTAFKIKDKFGVMRSRRD